MPDRHHDVVERRWDGEVWTEETRPATEGATFGKFHRDPVRFLQYPGWLLAAVFVVCTGIATYLIKVHPGTDVPDHRKFSTGIQWVAAPFGLIATLAIMLALLQYANRRLEFAQVTERENLKALVGWGIISGLVGVGIGLGIELALPFEFESVVSKKAEFWQWLPGPAEELGKVLVPVILWFTGRYRLPRQGLLLVLISGVTFGVFEGTEYSMMPHAFEVTRPFGELMHPLLAGSAAAIAWRFAWNRKSWFTVPGVLALFASMALHSINDGLLGLSKEHKFLGFVTFVLFAVLYFYFKHGTRQLVPPDNVAIVSPHWRPIARTHPAAESSGTPT